MDKIWISTYQHALDKRSAAVDLESFEELYALLEPEPSCPPDCPGKKCPNKDGLSWSPGFVPHGERCLDGNVQRLWFACFDLDGITTAQLEALCGLLEAAQVECLLHSTHSHRPPKLSLRLVFPLSRPVERKEWPFLWLAVIRRFQIPADPKAKNASRIYFTPRHPPGIESIHQRSEGALLDVDELLLEQRAQLKERKERVYVERPQGADDDDSIDLGALRKRLRSYDPQDDSDGVKRELIRRVHDEEPLADKPECTTVEFGDVSIYGRDDAVFRAAHIMGLLFPLATPVDAAMEILRPSVSKIPEYADDKSGEGFDFWMQKARFKFEKAQEFKLEEKAKEQDGQSKLAVLLARRRQEKTTAQVSGTEEEKKEEPKPESTSEEKAEEEEKDEHPDAWRMQLEMKVNERGDVRIEQFGYNVSVILENHPDWKGKLRFNELTQDVEYVGNLINLKAARAGLLSKTEDWLQKNEGLNLQTNVVKSRLATVARMNSYSPVEDYLNSLVWDGVPRIDHFLETYCRAPLVDVDGTTDITGYVRRVSAKWLISAVARALQPGCQVDTVVVLEGGQGKKKSTVLRALAGEWYSTSPPHFNDKEAQIHLVQSWLVEISELSAMSRTDKEVQKKIFSELSDKFRPPYGVKAEVFKRRCIFVGTTNKFSYLSDDTGNRRFWCIRCGEQEMDDAGVVRDRDQLWAEAVVRFRAGERWYMTAEEAEEAEKVATQRLDADDMIEQVDHWWHRMAPEQRPEFITTTQIAIDVLSTPKHQARSTDYRIGLAMKKLGFLPSRQPSGSRLRGFKPTEKMLRSPKRRTAITRLGMLTMIAGAKATNGEGE